MKTTTLHLAFLAAGLGICTPSVAQTKAPATTPSSVATNKLQVAPPEAVEHTVRKLAGQPVYGANGEKLGTIKDFVINKETGEVVYAVVSSGGVLGAGDTLRLVPLHALQASSTQGTSGFRVKVGRATWDQTPGLINEAFSDGLILITSDQERALAQLFGKNPSSRSSARADASIVRPGSDEFAASPWIHASHLRGKAIRAGGENIGRIEEIVFDSNHRGAAALVDVEDRIMPSKQRVLVPLTEVSLTSVRDPHFATMHTRHDFAQLDPSFVARDPLVVPTGHEVKRHDPRAPDATLASAARSARQALDQHADLSRADVRVTTENGMLILRGRVQNEKLKEQAEDAVEAAASGIKLQNYLIVDPR